MKRAHVRAGVGWVSRWSALVIGLVGSAAAAQEAGEPPAASGGWVDWLLGARGLSWQDPAVSLGWRYAAPPWLWAAIALGAVVLALWAYSRLLGPRWARVALGVARAMLLLAVVVLLAGPMLVRTDERVEPDWVLMLVDRSGSMAVRDTLGPDGGGVSREAQLRSALASHAGALVPGPGGLGEDRRVVWLGFGAQAFELGAAPPGDTAAAPLGVALGEPEALATNLRTAIEQALQMAAGRPVAGLVVLSDGRSPQATGVDLVQRLEQEAAPVYAVPLGAAEPPPDLALARVEAPAQSFLGDRVPIDATLRWSSASPPPPGSITVRLVDEATGEELDRAPAGPDPDEPVRLSAVGDTVGPTRWRIEAVYEPPPGGRTELADANNQRPVTVEVIDRALRVLYVEGYPRWEYRYLKNLLLREPSIDSSMLLVSADRAFAQEGDVPITRFPAEARELGRYDVIILGDVPAGHFTSGELALLRDHVAVGGAGLLWIGGSRHTPGSYQGTPLAELLPMAAPGRVSPAALSPAGVQPTPLARRLSVLQLTGPEVGGGGPGWPDALPPLRWVQDLGMLKPTAEVLARAQSPGTPAAAAPLIARLRFGAGQSLYVATDETWRWRYGRGEVYFEQFWVQLVRMLGRGRVQQLGQQAVLTTSTDTADRDQPVVIELVIDDPALIQRQLGSVAVAVAVTDAEAEDQTDPANPAEAGALQTLELRPVAQDTGGTDRGVTRRVYRGVWLPSDPGRRTLRVTEPALEPLDLTASLTVTSPGDEMARPEADHARLIELAEQSGGQVVEPDRLDRLRELLPNRARRIANDVTEPIWDSPLALIVLLVLLTAEWVGRRLIRLV